MPEPQPTTAYVPQLVVEWLEDGGNVPDARYRQEEGTLVFADISGFTPLSERLARRGRIGSEELTEILNRIFGRLLDVAYGYGGDLLKYGGDALLLLFRGEDDVTRAAVAAATMQRVLRELSRINTGAGVVRLRMSVGLHRGPILFALVGEGHRELLLTGPDVTTTVAMEAAADADEVLLSPESSLLVPPTWLADEKAGGRLLRLARAHGAMPQRPFSRRLSDLASLGVPEPLREHLWRGVGDGEHRQSTLAFVQFKGTDGLLEREGPARVAEELHGVVVACQRAAARHDVTFLATDIDADGGKVLFATGAPAAGVNDSDRLLFAMREIADHASALQLRVGANRGPAFAVDVGAPYRRTYAVMGDATNLAARVMGKASIGGVLATRAVVDDLRGEFDLRPREPFLVKGKSMPIVAFDVGAPTGAQREARADDAAPLIGHEAERAAIDAAVAEVRRGHGRALALVGAAGLGKTRLVTHLLEAAADRPAVVFEGGQYATHTPQFALRPTLRSLVGSTVSDDPVVVVEQLRAVVAASAPHLDPWLPLLNEAFGVEMAPTPETSAIEARFRRARVAALVVDLLDNVVPKPAVIVVEDAHWLDGSSAVILREVVDAAADRDWVVCVTSRELASMYLDSAPSVDVHLLQPLGPEDSRELAYQLLGDDPMPPLAVAALTERAAGNPMFLAQLLESARAGQGLEALPDSLEALVAARIDALDPDARSLFRSASVLGSRFPTGALAAMLAVDEDALASELDALDPFLVVDRGSSSCRFRSALLRQVAYETLPFRRRRELHARAAEVLEAAAIAGGERPVALLSLHCAAAGRHEAAWAYAREAGDLAAAGHAAVEATALYRRALESGRHLRDREPAELAAVWLALGEQSEYAGDTDGAIAAFGRARELARSDPVELAAVMLKDGWLRERAKNYADALRWYTRALHVLDAEGAAGDRADRLHAELVLAYGAARLRQGRFEEGRRWLDQAVEEAAASGIDDVLAHAYYLLDWALTDLGRTDEADAYRAQALPIYERLGDLSGQASVLNNLGIDAYYEGRWDEALVLYERSRRARERSGDVVQLGLVANNIGEILSDQGKLPEAEALFRDALRVWRGSGFRIGEGVATSNLGRCASRAGRFEEAQAKFAEAREIFDRIGAASFRADLDAREAERRLLAGIPGHAVALANVLVAELARDATATPAVISMTHRIAACALAVLGRFDDALVRVETAVGIAERASLEYELALALEVRSNILAGLGDPEAEAHAIAAASLFDRLGVASTASSRVGPLADLRPASTVPATGVGGRTPVTYMDVTLPLSE